MENEDIEMVCLNAGYINLDNLDTSASMVIEGSAFGMDGVSFSADSENGMFDTGIIMVAVVLAAIYAVVHIVEKVLKIRKDYLS